MTSELVAEGRRLSHELSSYVLRIAPIGMEVPLRVHSRETDAGGAPELHPAFIRWIGAICRCGRKAQCAPGCRAESWDEHLRDCEPACRDDTRFHASTHHNSPSRMKRALNQVRRLNPKAYDFVYLIVALHYSFEQASEKVNADLLSRGEVELTPAEFAVVWVSGASLLCMGF